MPSYYRAFDLVEGRRPLRPGGLYVLSREDVMANAFKVTVLFPAVAEQPDPPVSRRFTYKVNDGEPTTTEYPVEQAQIDFVAHENDVLELVLEDVDDAGNVSEPSVRVVTITDTVPPAQPGELGISLEEVAE